jgi:hypothetical protein
MQINGVEMTDAQVRALPEVPWDVPALTPLASRQDVTGWYADGAYWRPVLGPDGRLAKQVTRRI